jgi:DNA-binding NarL/FixJ family response regulator
MMAIDSQPPASGPAGAVVLTPRELEVLGLVRQGMTNAGISKRLMISQKAVKNHVAAIFRKLGCENRTQAAFLAEALGLVEP